MALLLGDVAVRGLTGGGQRVYWDVIGQGQQGAAVVLHLISSVPDYAMSGPTGLVANRVQVDCRAGTRAEALALSRAIDVLLSGYRGTVGGSLFSIFRDSMRSDFEKTEAEAFHLLSADYIVWRGAAA